MTGDRGKHLYKRDVTIPRGLLVDNYQDAHAIGRFVPIDYGPPADATVYGRPGGAPTAPPAWGLQQHRPPGSPLPSPGMVTPDYGDQAAIFAAQRAQNKKYPWNRGGGSDTLEVSEGRNIPSPCMCSNRLPLSLLCTQRCPRRCCACRFFASRGLSFLPPFTRSRTRSRAFRAATTSGLPTPAPPPRLESADGPLQLRGRACLRRQTCTPGPGSSALSGLR